MNSNTTEPQEKDFNGIQMNLARRNRNQKQVILLEECCSGLRVIPEIPPSPPFSKGGLGGISERRFPPKYS